MNALQLEIQKRHTLNWLIQGASEHAGMIFHHFIRDELNALDGKFVRLYDELALVGLLQYWRGVAALMVGSPRKYWNQVSTNEEHPFFGHPLLSRYGGMLAEETRRRCLARCKEKRVPRFPVAMSFRVISLIKRIRKLEAPHQEALIKLARNAASAVWGMPENRLHGELVESIKLEDDILPADSSGGQALRTGVVGISQIFSGDGELIVYAKAINWWILAKELVKGVAELICLHGLNRLDDEMYRRVVDVTDRYDFEHWMLQTGELWRRLLLAMPDGVPVANVLMRLAQSPAEVLHSALKCVIEQRAGASECLATLIRPPLH